MALVEKSNGKRLRENCSCVRALLKKDVQSFYFKKSYQYLCRNVTGKPGTQFNSFLLIFNKI